MTKHNVRFAHVENMIWKASVCGSGNAYQVRLFRSPLIKDERNLLEQVRPYEVTWSEIEVGQVLLALHIREDTSPVFIEILQFWHVLQKESDDLLEVEVCNIVGAAFDGDDVRDRFAGMLGIDPPA